MDPADAAAGLVSIAPPDSQDSLDSLHSLLAEVTTPMPPRFIKAEGDVRFPDMFDMPMHNTARKQGRSESRKDCKEARKQGSKEAKDAKDAKDARKKGNKEARREFWDGGAVRVSGW